MSFDLKGQQRPNLPEITSTTLPLLSTVLAGFSVTIIALIITKINSLDKVWPPTYLWPPQGNILALIFLAISFSWFVTSAFFGIRSQAYNYLNLTTEVQEIYEINSSDSPDDFPDYLKKVKDQWYLWYEAADNAFVLGVSAFVIGIGILLWSYIGIALTIFLAMILIAIIWGKRLLHKEHNRASDLKT